MKWSMEPGRSLCNLLLCAILKWRGAARSWGLSLTAPEEDRPVEISFQSPLSCGRLDCCSTTYSIPFSSTFSPLKFAYSLIGRRLLFLSIRCLRAELGLYGSCVHRDLIYYNLFWQHSLRFFFFMMNHLALVSLCFVRLRCRLLMDMIHDHEPVDRFPVHSGIS